MSRRTFRLSLQGWLLALILPSLGLVILVSAAHLYLSLSRLILEGFDRKLTAVTTTAAAFIDPADHQRLIEPLPLGSMTHDASDPTIWALDLSRHELMTIRPSDGLAEETGIHVPPEIDNISTGLHSGEFLLVDNGTGRFMNFPIATRRTTPAFAVEPPISAIDTVLSRHALYVAGRDLRRVDLTTGAVTRVSAAMPEPIRDLTYEPKRDIFWALSEDGDALLTLDPATGALRRRVKLRFAPGASAGPDAPVELRTLVYERVSGTLFGSATSLVVIDPDTGLVTDQGYLPSFGQEQGPLYARYARPMTRIMARANLTYLYTQIVEGRNHIIYGLDGTVGPNHSPLLSTDVVPEDEVSGIQRLLTEGSVYTSAIEHWQQWGLLKSAFTPIFGDNGRPVAMVGADVEIGTIQFQTRRALVLTFGFGAALLVLGGPLTFAAARRLTGPLGAIKTAALRAAAGDYGHRAEVARPRELRRLAERFTAAATALGREFHDLRDTVSARRTEREGAALLQRLEHLPPLAEDAPAGLPWAGDAPGGAVRQGDLAVAWRCRPGAEPLPAAARRAELAIAAAALLAAHGSDPEALAARLANFFPDDVAAWAVISPAGVRLLPAP